MMTEALAISLVAIFLVLLMQFRNLSEPLMVMCFDSADAVRRHAGPGADAESIRLHGLHGHDRLCGIVVRNAIILVDYINEKLREGRSLEQAAVEGRRAQAAAHFPHHDGRGGGSHADDYLRIEFVGPAGQRDRGRAGLFHVLYADRGAGVVRAGEIAHRQARGPGGRGRAARVRAARRAGPRGRPKTHVARGGGSGVEAEYVAQDRPRARSRRPTERP